MSVPLVEHACGEGDGAGGDGLGVVEGGGDGGRVPDHRQAAGGVGGVGVLGLGGQLVKEPVDPGAMVVDGAAHDAARIGVFRAGVDIMASHK